MKLFIIFIVTIFSFNAHSRGSSKPAPPPPPPKPTGGPFVDSSYPRCAKDVLGQLGRMGRNVRKRHEYPMRNVFRSYGYRFHLFNKNTLGIDNHFQGVQRLKGNNNFIFSGGDWKNREGHLFVISNGKLIEKRIIGRGDYWHPAGIQSTGNVLAVPVEEWKNKQVSKIHFYDIRNPSYPIELKNIMINRTFDKAGYLAFHRMADGRYILGVSGGGRGKFEIYLSKTSNILDGFHSPKNASSSGSGGSSEAFVKDCNGKLYLLQFRTTGSLEPIIPADQVINVHEFKLNEGGTPTLSGKIKEFKFWCGWHNCNFGAAGSIYVEDNGNLKIYSIPHWRKNYGRKIYIGEFY